MVVKKCRKLVYFDDLTDPKHWSWFCTEHPQAGGGRYRNEARAQAAANRDDHLTDLWPYETLLDEDERTGH